MAAFLIRRTASAVFTAFLASTLVFLALSAIPGNPIQVILGMNRGESAASALAARLGVLGSPAARYLSWIWHLLRGDLGVSINYGEPVSRLILDRLPVSLPIVAGAVLVVVVVAMPLGILAALKRGRLADPLIIGISQLGMIIPSFWLGLLLILLFGVALRWLPTSGFPGWDAGAGAALGSLALPVLAIGLAEAAPATRQVRAAVLEALGQDYVRTARGKGLGIGAIVRRHILRNTLVTLITVLGLEVAQLLAGSIIIENVFSLPGVGRLAFTAIQAHDYPLVQGVVLFYVIGTIGISLLVDLAYGLIDPRIEYR